MIGVNIKQARGNFFDSKAVLRKVPAAERKVLSKFGAFVRRRAQTSMKKKKGASPPGTPPYSHTGLIRKHTYFIYEPNKRTVVIGPALLSGRGLGDAQWLAEHGGDVARERKRRGGMVERYAASYPARPYMMPAFEAELTKMPDMWKDSIR